jgi:glycerol uptake facilitator protein
MVRNSTLLAECVGEFLGTGLLIFLGVSTVAASVTTSAQVGLWQVAVVWGFSAALSTYLVSHISGAHFNPAVTIAFAVSRRTRFPLDKVIPYIAAQFLGAMMGAVMVVILYGPAIRRFEKIHSITRGEANSTLSGMPFGEYFPNPQMVQNGMLEFSDVSHASGLFAEAIGTMVLILMVRALTDPANSARPSSKQVPFFIGFTVAVIVSFIAPLTQAGLNPARDFGPRVVAFFAGWGKAAIPGPRNEFWVYIVGPIIGALAGGTLYDHVVYPTYIATAPNIREEGKRDDEAAVRLIHTINGVKYDAVQSAGTQRGPVFSQA